MSEATFFSENKAVVFGGVAALAGVGVWLYLQNQTKPKPGPDLPAWAKLLEKTFDRSEKLQSLLNSKLRDALEGDGDDDDAQSSMTSEFGAIADEEAKQFISCNPALFGQLFLAYDTNGDGDLSLEECSFLTRDSMLVVQMSLAKYVRRLVTSTYQGQKQLFKALSHEEDHDEGGHSPDSEQFNIDQSAIDLEVAACIPIGDKIIAELLRDTDSIAKACWTAMDIDHDGKVSREEFVHHFFSLNQSNVGLNKIWMLIQQQRAKNY